MGRSLKKGPFVDEKLLKKVERLTADRQKRADQDVGAPLDGDA